MVYCAHTKAEFEADRYVQKYLEVNEATFEEAHSNSRMFLIDGLVTPCLQHLGVQSEGKLTHGPRERIYVFLCC